MNFETVEPVAWNDLISPQLDWIENLALSAGDELSHADVVVVAVRAASSVDELARVFESAKLAPKLRDQLAALVAARRICQLRAPLAVSEGGTVWVLVPETRLGVSGVEAGLQAGIEAASEVSAHQVRSVAFVGSARVSAVDMVEGFWMGCYQYRIHRQVPSHGVCGDVTEISVVEAGIGAAELEALRVRGGARLLTRCLADAPSNKLTPSVWARLALVMGERYGLKCKVRASKQLRELGMEMFLSVGHGSVHEPHLICFEIEGKDPSRTVALVGKGLTFDTGGTNLKPSAGIGPMKYDMCGGAAVCGAAYAFARQQPAVNVVCLVGAVENLLSAGATRPGDVVRSRQGKTVQVDNTDAEGRLVLGDVIDFARTTWQLELMIDVATLTSASLIAMGHFAACAVSTDSQLCRRVIAAGAEVGERMWEMPLFPELAATLACVECADLANIPSPKVQGGVLTAAAFLAEFAGDTPWVHLDIAPVGNDCAQTGMPRRGGSGFAATTLVRVVEKLASR